MTTEQLSKFVSTFVEGGPVVDVFDDGEVDEPHAASIVALNTTAEVLRNPCMGGI
ncbi:hypothetical protein [Mycobacterium sp.]|uniref:hypothetical protein n=1 Tax=Mycobacterium sp. TaxID=1785 RepID=UPI002C57DF39|nr:hypothetical protein [Mycobacterium sp.]HTQ19516.1 hypothetical protein [Mycobacterium sp.]